ncbi:MAG TPA: MlaD family protein [Verrucomicrobiae bacterium]|nr:MlaD family protein [Verrucomicrobiae bacterium]
MNTIQDRIIALTVIASTLGLGYVLLSGIADFELKGETRKVTIDFDRIDNIKAHVTEIKMAGHPIGKVSEIRLLRRDERTGLRDAMLAQNPSATNSAPPAIRVTGEIDPKIILSAQTVASIRQPSLMSENYIELAPGAPDSDPLPPDKVIAGTSGKGMNDLMDPGAALLVNLRDAASNVKSLTSGLEDKVPNVINKLEGLLADVKIVTSGLTNSMPATINKLDKVLENAKTLTGDLSSEENRERIRATLENAKSLTGDLKVASQDIKVVSQNLKVVSTHAKLITGTLGQRPWRLLFGGKEAVNQLPDEQRIISSNKPVPVKPAEGHR